MDLKPFLGGPASWTWSGGEISMMPFRRDVRRSVLFKPEGVYLSPLAAHPDRGKGCILVGTDAMSVDPGDAADLPVHRTLLSRGVAILENLDLSSAMPGIYQLVALPIRFRELDASPVQAILIRK